MSKTILRGIQRAKTAPFVYRGHRDFITLPGTEPASLTATRTLPYNSNSLYSIIADVSSYSHFLPYCQASDVTKWSAPDGENKVWPSEANLRVGWGGYEETFTSRIYCVPGSIVEALGGDAVTEIPHSQLSHHKKDLSETAKSNSIFQTLRTRWTVKPIKPASQSTANTVSIPGPEQTEVYLSIDYAFSNPLYAMVSQAVIPKFAGLMIEAFEVRAKGLLGASEINR